jgi:teichuronic acid biosynthesis glycosyltransferase TuaC
MADVAASIVRAPALRNKTRARQLRDGPVTICAPARRIRSRQMRVLVVTSMYPSPAHPGLGGFVRDQVEALRALDGVEVEVFAIEPGPPTRFLKAARELRGTYGGERFDVVHAHHGLTGWSALAVRGAPRVLTFHGTDLSHPVVGPLSRFVARFFDLPAPVSADLARQPGGGLPGAGTKRAAAILPCGVNLDRFSPRDRREARRARGLEPDGRYLLFPADPARSEKRHDRALQLARAAGGVELLTYGDLQPEQVPDTINAANAVVATSEREGFGLAPLEALACNVPILSTDVGIAPLALRGIDGAFCAPFEVEGWMRALRPHLEDPDPRVEGRRRAALFDRNRMAARVFQAYGELVAETTGEGAATTAKSAA